MVSAVKVVLEILSGFFVIPESVLALVIKNTARSQEVLNKPDDLKVFLENNAGSQWGVELMVFKQTENHIVFVLEKPQTSDSKNAISKFFAQRFEGVEVVMVTVAVEQEVVNEYR